MHHHPVVSSSRSQTSDETRNQLVPLSQLAELTPRSRSGKKRHRSAFYRYAKNGVRGVRLKTTQLPDGLYSSVAAWDEFIAQLTAQTTPTQPPRTTASTSTRRQRLIEQEIASVRRTIRRSAP